MLGCLVFSLPFPRIRLPSRTVQVEKIQFGCQDKNVGYRLTLEIEFSLTHGESSSCACQNSFVASAPISKTGALHSNYACGRPEGRATARIVIVAKLPASRIETVFGRNFSSRPESQARAFRQRKMRARQKDARQSASSVRGRSAQLTCKRLLGVEIRAANPKPAQTSSTIRDIAAEVLRRH